MKNYWEDKEVIARFAAKEPDNRMQAILANYEPKTTVVLDLGCAAGRNTVYLAENGFDFYAIDFSAAMIDKTRERIAKVLDPAKANRQVLKMKMDALSFEDNYFDFIVALGIIQDAQSEEEWHRVVGECARVLKPSGKILVAHFSPDSDPSGEGIAKVTGTEHVYTGFAPNRRLNLLSSQELDENMLEHNFIPLTKTRSVKVATKRGYRSTVNAYYQLRGSELSK